MHYVENKGAIHSAIMPPGKMWDRGAQDALRDETLLVLELTNRIANELTCAFSTICETARRSNSPAVKSTLSKLSCQLMRQAELMQALQIPDGEASLDAAGYLGRICLAISRSRFEELNIHMVFAADSVPMAPNACLRLGMIISELLTNLAHCAFSDHIGGTVKVDLCRRGQIAECRVSDTGCRRTNVDPGYGLAIARELITGHGGSIEQEFGPSGSTSILQLPLQLPI